MIYNNFQNEKLSLLGFGAMRLPCDADGKVDEAQVAEMVRLAFEGGVNYIDTAWPYHGGQSESVLGRVLADYPRDSYYLASKFPGHQISERYDPAAIFEEQLRKCQVDYFDFYLLHNVCEQSLHTYDDPRWGIVDYFLEQRKLGRIRHLGFSSHAGYDCLKDFLDRYGDKMEFCQIQLNYLDWTLQDAKARYELLTERNIPVWVMEPLRGGRLANLPTESAAKLHALRSDEGVPAWAFRWLQGLDNVKMILSGMSSIDQMQDNLRTFSPLDSVTEEEKVFLQETADLLSMYPTVPCNDCKYCMPCPYALDIPGILLHYNKCVNEGNVPKSTQDPNYAEARRAYLVGYDRSVPKLRQADHCTGCNECSPHGPQGIDIPKELRRIDQFVESLKVNG